MIQLLLQQFITVGFVAGVLFEVAGARYMATSLVNVRF